MLQLFDLLFILGHWGHLITTIALQAIDSFQKSIGIFDLMLDQRPKLFEKCTQIFRLFLRLLELLIEEFFAISEQLDQLLIFCLQGLDLLDVDSLL